MQLASTQAIFPSSSAAAAVAAACARPSSVETRALNELLSLPP